MKYPRYWFLLLAAGFALSAYASFVGGGPSWPNKITWGIVASIAALAMLAYAIGHTRPLLRIATSAAMVASVSRGIGWWITLKTDWPRIAGAVGNFVIITALVAIVYIKARRTT